MPRVKRKPSVAARNHEARPTVQPHAEIFRRSRRDRAAEITQDYVEAIAIFRPLWARRGGGLARQLGVTHVTVNRTSPGCNRRAT